MGEEQGITPPTRGESTRVPKLPEGSGKRVRLPGTSPPDHLIPSRQPYPLNFYGKQKTDPHLCGGVDGLSGTDLFEEVQWPYRGKSFPFPSPFLASFVYPFSPRRATQDLGPPVIPRTSSPDALTITRGWPSAQTSRRKGPGRGGGRRGTDAPTNIRSRFSPDPSNTVEDVGPSMSPRPREFNLGPQTFGAVRSKARERPTSLRPGPLRRPHLHPNLNPFSVFFPGRRIVPGPVVSTSERQVWHKGRTTGLGSRHRKRITRSRFRGPGRLGPKPFGAALPASSVHRPGPSRCTNDPFASKENPTGVFWLSPFPVSLEELSKPEPEVTPQRLK